MRPEHDAPPAGIRPLAESFVRGEFTLAVICDRSFDEVAERFEASVREAHFEVQQQLDLGAFLAGRGFARHPASRVYGIGSAAFFDRILGEDASLAHLLPWRVALTETDLETVRVETGLPTAVLGEFSPSAGLARVARNLEKVIGEILVATQRGA